MKRGLKLIKLIYYGHGGNRPKTCPDEEGIETQRTKITCPPAQQRPKTCPDEEGIETVGVEWEECSCALDARRHATMKRGLKRPLPGPPRPWPRTPEDMPR